MEPNLPIEIKINYLKSEELSKPWVFKQTANVDFFLNDKLLN